MNARRLRALSDQMGKIDESLFEAEKAKDIPVQIELLHARARCWYAYAELLQAADRDHYTALGAARRDETSAARLEADQ